MKMSNLQEPAFQLDLPGQPNCHPGSKMPSSTVITAQNRSTNWSISDKKSLTLSLPRKLISRKLNRLAVGPRFGSHCPLPTLLPLPHSWTPILNSPSRSLPISPALIPPSQGIRSFPPPQQDLGSSPSAAIAPASSAAPPTATAHGRSLRMLSQAESLLQASAKARQTSRLRMLVS